MDQLEFFQKQHYENYIKAIKEIVNNNTNALIDDDINSLITTPPLDSMDQIKIKLLSIAKKEKVVLDTDLLNSIVNKYRTNLEHSFSELKKYRIDYIVDIIERQKKKNEYGIIKINKKDFSQLNSKLKKNIKEIIQQSVDSYLSDDIFKLFSIINDNLEKKKKVENEINKFIGSRGIYQKQLIDSIDFKILVKDTTLMNGIKEQSERYNFTMNNSRIFN